MRSLVPAGLLGGAIFASHAFAAGFALQEQSASGLGNAYAGAGALAEDASTVWWNPAGMARLPGGKQALVAANAINTSSRFSNGASVVGTASNPAFTGNGGDAGDLSLVPNAYFTMDIAPRWKAGLGINAPFGLATKYDPSWVGRFQGIESKIETVNINPSVSWAMSDSVSFGAGLDWQRGTIKLLSGANYAGAWAVITSGSAPLSVFVPPGTEGQNRTNVEGDAWGYNLGALWNVTPDTRVGVAYRSSLKYNLNGTTSFSGRPSLAGLPAAAAAAGAAFNAVTADGNVSLSLKSPDMASVSVSHTLNSRWQILGDLDWTGWSKLKSLPLTRDTGATLDTLTFNFRDTVRVSLGANYQLNDAWTLKMGYAYDQSPVPNAESRSVRLPDSDRNWLAAGAKYRMSRASAIDFGYAHLWMKDASINNNQNPPVSVKGLVNGSYASSVDILSVQYAYLF